MTWSTLTSTRKMEFMGPKKQVKQSRDEDKFSSTTAIRDYDI